MYKLVVFLILMKAVFLYLDENHSSLLNVYIFFSFVRNIPTSQLISMFIVKFKQVLFHYLVKCIKDFLFDLILYVPSTIFQL